jgi:RNA polymerase nonessential primary-like sigma factor
MPATPFYADTEFDQELLPYSFESNGTSDDLDASVEDDLVDLESVGADAASFSKTTNRRTTDLVRLYLQEIGRVRLLRRDEEVSEAQKVQRYMRLLDLRAEFAQSSDTVIERYVHLIETHDRLVSQLGHRPSLERWAATAGAEVSDLKPCMAAGKHRWAELAGLSVKELENIQAQGNRASWCR